jgi:hypothetical protein
VDDDEDEDEPEPTPTPAPTSTPAPTATATTPAGPFASLSGASTADVGEAVTVYAVTGGGNVLRTDITLPNGQVRPHTAGETWVPTAPGCYVFSILAYFATGQTLSGAHAVSVGGVSCGGQG